MSILAFLQQYFNISYQNRMSISPSFIVLLHKGKTRLESKKEIEQAEEVPRLPNVV